MARTTLLVICLCLSFVLLTFALRPRSRSSSESSAEDRAHRPISRSSSESAEERVTVDVFVGTAWEQPVGVCTGLDYQIFAGDFNGDGRQEVLCHNSNTGSKEIYLTRPDGSLATESVWKKDMGWCNHEGAQLFVGDFNGDGRSDILCHDTKTGKKWVSLAQPGGVFLGTTWQKDLNWCKDDSAELFVADINADGRYDMLCHRAKDGYKWVSYAKQDGTFPGTSWEKGMGWCISNDYQLFVADFNGDRRADLLCHGKSDGKKWVAAATPSGTFVGTTWKADMGWCNHAGAEILIGDFNKDKRSDMMCSDTTGRKWIAYSGENGSFTSTSWESDMGWCTSDNKLIIADVNGDGGDDMVCHYPSNGNKYIAFNQIPTP